MTPHEAQVQINRIADEMLKISQAGEVTAAKYEATMQLYGIAAKQESSAEMEAYRDQLHTLLDVILDSAMQLQYLQNNIRKILLSTGPR